MRIFRPHPLKSTGFYLSITSTLALFMLDYARGSVGGITAWVLAINIVMLLVVLKDKISAKLHIGRVPEGALLLLGILGGFPGLILGSFLFNHKSTKREFRNPMWFLFTVQLIIIIYFVVVTF